MLTPGQLGLPFDHDAAWTRAEQSMEAAAGHADRVEAHWRHQALGALTMFASLHAQPFLIEEARAFAEANGLPQPPDARAWGSVTQAAARGENPRIRRIGYAAAASSNCSPKVLWIGARYRLPNELEK
jgi:hypothetical protein